MNALEWHKAEFGQLVANKSRLPHALLLRGRRGIGKMHFARAFAQALLCDSPQPSGMACDRCAACHWFDAGTHRDFRQVEPEMPAEHGSEESSDKKGAVQISVDQVRALADFVNI